MFRIVFRVNFCYTQLRALSNLEIPVKKYLGNKLHKNRENLELDQIGTEDSEN